MAVVQGGEGHQGQLAIRREEEAAGVAQQRQQGLEGELVERLGGAWKEASRLARASRRREAARSMGSAGPRSRARMVASGKSTSAR